MIVDHRAIEEGTIDVGYPVARNNGYLLVELPRETLSGAWRIWIDQDVIADNSLERVA